jgi:hypothetical protein
MSASAAFTDNIGASSVTSEGSTRSMEICSVTKPSFTTYVNPRVGAEHVEAMLGAGAESISRLRTALMIALDLEEL